MDEEIKNVMSFVNFYIRCREDGTSLCSLENVSIHIHDIHDTLGQRSWLDHIFVSSKLSKLRSNIVQHRILDESVKMVIFFLYTR